MWTADKIIYNGIDTYIKAYQGSSLIWEKNIPADPADDITLPYVTFRAEEAGSSVSLSYRHPNHTLEYSTDKINWSAFVTSPTGWTSIRLANIGDEVYVRGKLTTDNLTLNHYTQFFIRYGKVAAYGNVNAIWNYEDLNAPLIKNCGYRLFNDCKSLTKAPKLPATTLADGCYSEMLSGCTSLTKAPELPATTLAYACYVRMFSRCESLVEAPELPATTLAERCYIGMFSYCYSLIKAPKLPVTTLTERCYSQMFMYCESLTKAPKLPATTLADGCYNQMFLMANINEITCLATDISALDCVKEWLMGNGGGGTFYKDPSMTDWPTGTSGIPSGWTVLDYTA